MSILTLISDYYTGTEYRPESINIFIKSQGKLTFQHLVAQANQNDYIPVKSSFTTVGRITEATQRLFKELSQTKFTSSDPHLLESWNAFKNLCRGLIAFFPIAGNITLFLFDQFRNAVYCSNISQTVKDKNNIIGVAIDGKVVCTADFTKFIDRYKGSLPTSDEQTAQGQMPVLSYLCHTLLERYAEQNLKMTEIFRRIPELIG